MIIIDRLRIAAVNALEVMGYTFAAGEWQRPGSALATTAMRKDDALHALLVQRADQLADEERELAAIVTAIQAYEGKRWPGGKEPGGKG